MRSGVAWPNDIFVDLDAEGMRDLLADAHAAELGIAPLHLDDGRDEFRGRTFGTGFAAMRRERKEQAVFAIHQALWNLNSVAGLMSTPSFGIRRGLTNSVVSPSSKRSIGQIRRALPGSITDQKLMFEQKRLCGDGAYTTWAEQLREDDEEVDGEGEAIAHGANGTSPPVRARLHGADGLRHTTNSPPTGSEVKARCAATLARALTSDTAIQSGAPGFGQLFGITCSHPLGQVCTSG
jgi:hypothetical protein